MKAALVLDQDADLSSCPEYRVASIQWRKSRGKLTPYFPAGTIYEGYDALMICRTGQGSPLDEECAAAVGMTEVQLKSAQLEYKMNALGINDKGDRELYRAGVILGYDDKLEYIHGPNWDKYQAAKNESEDEEL